MPPDTPPPKSDVYTDARPVTRARAPPSFLKLKNSPAPSRTAWPAARACGVGLKNLGNSCFLNAVLQALAHCPPLANTVLEAPVETGGGRGPSTTAAAGAPSLSRLPAFGGPCGAPACGQLYEEGNGPPAGADATSNRGGLAAPAAAQAGARAHAPPLANPPRPVPCAHCLLWSRVCRSLAPDTPHPDAPQDLFDNLRSTISRTLTPGRQEDAHEFLRTLLDAVDRDRRRGLAAAAGGGPPPPAGAWVSEVEAAFGGRLLSRVTCAACGAHSDTLDPCLDLSVEVGPGVATLGDALAAFARPEPLAGEDAYRCAACRTVGPATKCLALSSTPAALVIHLKRFAASTGGGRGAGRAGLVSSAAYGHAATGGGAPTAQNDGCPAAAFPLSPNPHPSPGPLPAKITRHIPFPPSLTLGGPLLAPGTHPGMPYTLTGVVIHAGTSPRGGHYTALVRGRGGDWFLADDGRVARVGGEPGGGYPAGLGAVLAAQAYILFYARTDGNGKGGAGGRGGAGARTPPRPPPPASAAATRRPSRSPTPPKAGPTAPAGKRPAAADSQASPSARRRRSTPPPAASLGTHQAAPSRLAAASAKERIAYVAPVPPRSRTAVGAPPRTRGAFLVAAAVAGSDGPKK